MNSERSTQSKYFLPFLISVILVIGIILGAILSNPNWVNSTHRSSDSDYGEMDYLLQLIDENYVDSVDVETLKSKAYQAFLAELDPHSSYLPPIDNLALEEEMSGEFEGIGVQFEIVRDTVMVDAALPGGPSEKVGILAGDRIVEVDGRNIAGIEISSQDVVKNLRGKAGTKVIVGVVRPGSSSRLYFTIERDKIPLNTVDAAFMLNANTGFIRLSRFSETSAKEILSAIDQLNQSGMTQLILDLRGNPGGLLSSAIEICDALLPAEELIVYTRGLKRAREDYFATSEGLFEKKPVCILVDRYSASASEIVAGAVQDHDRGWIVGERTFGKGLVQEPMPLSNGAAITLTVARYYTPSGRCIQRPYGAGAEAYYSDNKPLENENDSTPFYTDSGRIVYGGGGILPDILVEETELNMDLLLSLYATGNLQEIMFNLTQKFRNQWVKSYPTAKDWIKNRDSWNPILQASLLQQLNAAEKELWTANPAGREDVLRRIQQGMARNIWGMKGYYEVSNLTDVYIKAALKALK
jgi:carboxyl-terminal processing protease